MAKLPLKVARQYASALVESAEIPALDGLRDALNAFAAAWQSSPELEEALLNPAVPLPVRQQVVEDICARLYSQSPILRNFLLLAVENRRIAGITEIAEAFSQAVDEVKRLLEVEVTTATELPGDESREIRSALERDFGSSLKLEFKVNPALIGGMVVRSGDRVLDNSIRTSIDRMRSALVS